MLAIFHHLYIPVHGYAWLRVSSVKVVDERLNFMWRIIPKSTWLDERPTKRGKAEYSAAGGHRCTGEFSKKNLNRWSQKWLEKSPLYSSTNVWCKKQRAGTNSTMLTPNNIIISNILVKTPAGQQHGTRHPQRQGDCDRETQERKRWEAIHHFSGDW